MSESNECRIAVSAQEARLQAQARFGSTTVVADECRDERGTAFVDNTIRDVRFALRSFRRAPLAALTIVATVAIGLGVVAACLLAAWIPATRAARLDPMRTLRQE